MVRKEVALHRCAADLRQSRRVPAIAAQERNGDPKLASLERDQPDLIIVTGNKNRLGIGRFDRGKLRLEILIARTVTLLRHDRAAVLREILFEKLREADAV